ncbi:DUF2620 domain-containing protein [Paenibacillus sp. ACRRX]|uniref:DUF2620 family protein n=1 Tax=Paenibacillus sp. ACRRX TaxID=2918206 RepID=UPI001EF67210|nr:DUF2620 family protein [Paenibacillus sp. ACRRX]MCG7406970.1 DUF2620 domain-containing protein [Paenibacillus sp. ACRRX]
MLRFVVAGLNKDKLAKTVAAAGGNRVSVQALSDIEAALQVKNGQADYYMGACNTGGGAALSMAIGILTFGKCATITKNGERPNQDIIKGHIQDGVVAFGMTVDSIDETARCIVNVLLERQE